VSVKHRAIEEKQREYIEAAKNDPRQYLKKINSFIARFRIANYKNNYIEREREKKSYFLYIF
jgi:hypothetical protein